MAKPADAKEMACYSGEISAGYECDDVENVVNSDGGGNGIGASIVSNVITSYDVSFNDLNNVNNDERINID